MNSHTNMLVNAATNALAEQRRERGEYMGGVESAVEYVKDKMAEEGERECFAVLLCDTQHNVIEWQAASPETKVLSEGYRREIARQCLEKGTQAVFLATNHTNVHMSPSSKVLPTKEDRDITRRLGMTFQLFGIQLVDHIILSKEKSYCSMVKEGILTSTIGAGDLQIRESRQTEQQAWER